MCDAPVPGEPGYCEDCALLVEEGPSEPCRTPDCYGRAEVGNYCLFCHEQREEDAREDAADQKRCAWDY
jgi:hypothetical protein